MAGLSVNASPGTMQVLCTQTHFVHAGFTMAGNSARSKRTAVISGGVYATAVAIAATSVAGAEGPPGDVDWPAYNHRLSGVRFSDLAQIDSSNVNRLREVCRTELAPAGSLSTGPILAAGLLYVTMNNLTAALDPTSCHVEWKSQYLPDEAEVLPNNRGVAYLDGQVYRGTGDGRLLDYDAKSGRERWRRKMGNPRGGEFASAAPIAWHGRVFLGLSGGDLGVPGRMMSFDASSGRRLWSFDLVAQAGEFGSETWSGNSALRGGGATWSSYTLDEKTRELFVSVDNPAPGFNGSDRLGDNLFTDSVVVLDANTGRRLWHVQLRKHDTRNYGTAAPAVLMTVAGRSLIAQGSKDGYLYVIDRATHAVVYRSPATTIVDDDSAPSVAGIKACPGVSGGYLYNSPSFDPHGQTLISGTVDWCSKLYLDPPRSPSSPPGDFVGGRHEPIGAGRGWVTAMDANDGRILWKRELEAPVFGAVTSTAGGVTFAGDHNGTLYAFNSADGSVLWRQDTGGSVAGGIITYRIGPKQYLATTSGNATLSPASAAKAPTIIIYALGPVPAREKSR
jgi:alcohol dehydrogenase (cytochrome c)